MKKMNLPNILSFLRVFLVPVFVASMLLMQGGTLLGCIVPAVIYIITGLTDMLDGKIQQIL